MYHCRHKGCPQHFVWEEPRNRHEQQNHIECSCGKMFTVRGLACHLSFVKRKGVEAHQNINEEPMKPTRFTRADALREQQRLFPNSTLPAICMEVQMAIGEYENEWEDAKIIDVRHMLAMRLDTWHWDSTYDYDFDLLIYHMLIHILKLLDGYLQNNNLR